MYPEDATKLRTFCLPLVFAKICTGTLHSLPTFPMSMVNNAGQALPNNVDSTLSAGIYNSVALQSTQLYPACKIQGIQGTTNCKSWLSRVYCTYHRHCSCAAHLGPYLEKTHPPPTRSSFLTQGMVSRKGEATSKICFASSLVGEITSAPTCKHSQIYLRLFACSVLTLSGLR